MCFFGRLQVDNWCTTLLSNTRLEQSTAPGYPLDATTLSAVLLKRKP